jgi:hypothetical protein
VDILEARPIVIVEASTEDERLDPVAILNDPLLPFI